MNTDTVSSTGEREYDLKAAAELLGKNPSALRMQIRRGSIRANTRPIDGDDEGGRYKLYIPESEVEKERKRLERETQKANARTEPSTTNAGGPATVGRAMPAAGVAPDVAAALDALLARQEQLEQELRQEREDTRALIRAVEQQVDMLKTMVTAFIARPQS